MEVKLLKRKRALKVGDFLVIADLHIGYEKESKKKGYIIPNQRKEFVKRIKNLKEMSRTSKLIILGDVKHNIPRASLNEKYEIPNFFREISKLFKEIIVIKGNHDGNLEKMVHEDNVKIMKEFSLGNFGFIHGHRYPTDELMKCKILIMAHSHPTFKIKDNSRTTHNYPCWIVGEIKNSKLKKYNQIKIKKVLVVPAFNPLLYGYKGVAGPLSKAIKIKEIYLLDLTKVK